MTNAIKSINATASGFQTVDVRLRLAQVAAAQPVYASVNGHAQAIIAHGLSGARPDGVDATGQPRKGA